MEKGNAGLLNTWQSRRRQEHKQSLCCAAGGTAMQILTQFPPASGEGWAEAAWPCPHECSLHSKPAHCFLSCGYKPSTFQMCNQDLRAQNSSCISHIYSDSLWKAGLSPWTLLLDICNSTQISRDLYGHTTHCYSIESLFNILLYFRLIKMPVFSVLATVTPNGEQKPVKHYQGHNFQA